MTKKLSEVPDFIDLQLENSIVMIDKGLNEELLIQVINETKPFSQQAKKALINPFHHTALNYHINELVFVAFSDVHFEQFVGTLLEVDSRLDDQVNSSSQVDQVLLSQVVDLLLLLFLLHSLLFFQHLLLIIMHSLQVDDILLA